MSGRACPRCGCSEIDKDAATGGSYCTNCGSVLEENAIVAEVEFFETGTGGHGALGQFVSADAPSKLRIGSVQGASTKESREVTLQKARRLIHELASQLGGLNQHCKDTAVNFFSMAIRGGLTRGRRSTHVVAACLYITCRLEGTPHLLLDFSDALQINVFELGKVYSFLARKLMIKLPQLDPCDYVMRFAHCLNFGDKEHDVAMVALRLVQRMKRDWISIGRRPTGLCGAALLLAARYHNFRRTVNDVIRVVNISESVVRKRLEEFATTPSSELTLDEFHAVDLEQTADPPAFREARQKAKFGQQQKPQQPDQDFSLWGDRFKSLEQELVATEARMDEALDAATSSKRSPYAKYSKVDTPKKVTFALTPDRAASGEDEIADNQTREFVQEQLLADIIPVVEEDQAACSSSTGTDEEPRTPADRYRSLRPTLESLGITKSLYNTPASKTSTEIETESGVSRDDDALEISDIDDDEINSYLLTDDEVKMKEELWVLNYEDFMKALEEKRRLKEEERIKEEQEGGKKKKTPVRRKKPAQLLEPAASASEAIEKIVQEKKLSNKINYEVLKSLVVTDNGKRGEQTPATPATPVTTADSSSSKLSTARRSMSRFKPYIGKKSA